MWYLVIYLCVLSPTMLDCQSTQEEIFLSTDAKRVEYATEAECLLNGNYILSHRRALDSDPRRQWGMMCRKTS